MEIFKEIIEWPENVNVNISNNKIIFIHKKYGAFTINYTINNQQIILSSGDELNSVHLFRICKIKNIYCIDEIFDMLSEIKIKINAPFKYCTICGNYCELSNSYPYHCSKDKDNICKNQIYTKWTDNIIKNFYCEDNLVFKFILITAVQVIKNKKELVFNPFPPSFNNFNDLIILLESNFFNNDCEEIYRIVDESKDDGEILKILGENIYSFIKFIIISNNTRLKYESIKSDKEFNKNLKLGKDLICFEVIHDIVKKELFNVCEPEYLFHGSGIANWYSIMRNGLKNYSGTNLMAHGAAFGNGIYFSDNVKLSYGYSTMGSYGDDNIKVIGIAQILNKEKYKKGANIFVVPNEDQVLLKYLIVNSPKSININDLCNFITNREKEIKSSNKMMLNIVTRRLAKEHQYIYHHNQKYNTNYQILITYNISKIIWQIDFIKNNNVISILIYFGTSYPVEPPFFMIKSPKINIDNNSNLFNDGSIYLDILTPKLWKSKTKILNVLLCLSNIINTLNIQIIDSGFEYNYHDVLEKYDNTLKMNNVY